jgi:hypothetical protein
MSILADEQDIPADEFAPGDLNDRDRDAEPVPMPGRDGRRFSEHEYLSSFSGPNGTSSPFSERPATPKADTECRLETERIRSP